MQVLVPTTRDAPAAASTSRRARLATSLPTGRLLVPATPASRPLGAAFADGDVLVRLPAPDRSWPRSLPAAPDGWLLTVTLGHPRLVPVDADRLDAAGYRIVGTASEHRPIGLVVDVLVPAALRTAEPDWWGLVLARAERVFDLRLGPVQQVLAAELELHRQAHAG
jgi:hypothetical protein